MGVLDRLASASACMRRTPRERTGRKTSASLFSGNSLMEMRWPVFSFFTSLRSGSSTFASIRSSYRLFSNFGSSITPPKFEETSDLEAKGSDWERRGGSVQTRKDAPKPSYLQKIGWKLDIKNAGNVIFEKIAVPKDIEGENQ